MKIAILTNGPKTWAGSRLRGFWLEDVAPVHFRAYGPGDALDGLDDCETVIFQKRQSDGDLERARRYKAEGRTVIYDVCDPIWWFDPPAFQEMVRVADAVTTSSEGLTQAICQRPDVQHVVTIPDRMLASFHPTTAAHVERERLIFVWFGASQNRAALSGALPILTYVSHHLPIELRIIDDAPHARMAESSERAKVTYIPWALETIHAQLTACDIALLPPYPGPWGELKSNNKHVTAWWCGLPVVSGFDVSEIQRFVPVEARRIAGEENRQKAEAEYDIRQSVVEWKVLAAALRDGAGGVINGAQIALAGEPGPEIVSTPSGATVVNGQRKVTA